MIRPATPEDAPLLARLRLEFRASFGEVDEPENIFLLRCERWIHQTLRENRDWNCWIAEPGVTVAGTIWLQFIEKIPNPVAELEWHGYITNLFVREAFRGKALGSQLLAKALEACRTRGVDAVFLWPTPQSRSLYTRHGFTVAADIMTRR
jgi:ribosomal protein S18 acetylase RimI-like enzyme